MINNRQGGRRRGRGGQGGQRGPNLGGGQPGNRQDNRQRGNAAQLLEKYKSMARDSQLAGDRVQTEYYLQYADHYFRVLSESRSRFEEQNPRRGRDDEFDDDDGQEELVEASEEASSDERPQQRPERGERFNRRERPRRDDGEFHRARENAAPEPRQSNGGGETIAFDVLPPAIGRDEPGPEAAVASEEESRRPRRRPRAARVNDDDGEVAPAA